MMITQDLIMFIRKDVQRLNLADTNKTMFYIEKE